MTIENDRKEFKRIVYRYITQTTKIALQIPQCLGGPRNGLILEKICCPETACFTEAAT